MNRRRTLAAMAGFAVLPLLAACPGGEPAADQDTEGDQPDCDFGDRLEGDEDCDPRPSPSKAATPAGRRTPAARKSTAPRKRT